MRDVLTTFHWPLREAWMRRAETIDPAATPWRSVLRRVIVEGPRYPTVVLNGSTGAPALYLDRLAAIGLRRLRRRRPRVILIDATWSVGTGWRRTLARCFVRAFDGPHVVYGVLSSAELQTFPAAWGVPAERVRYLPFLYTWPDEELDDVPDGDGSIFAGGDSLRDYGPVIAAGAQLPVPITVATRRTGVPSAASSNVRIGPLSEEQYQAAVRAASVVVVPIVAGLNRSAGQQSYLNAMAMGKLVVVSDTLGARDYVEDGRTGVIVPPGDPEAMRRALAWATDPAHRSEVDEIRRRGQREVRRRFGPDRYVAAILALVDEGGSRPV